MWISAKLDCISDYFNKYKDNELGNLRRED
jgi:hypothetical protein